MNFNGGTGFIGTGNIVGPVTIDGDLKVTGELEVDGNVTMGDSLTVAGDVLFTDELTVDQQTTLSAVSVSNNLDVTGAATFLGLEAKQIFVTEQPLAVATNSQTLTSGSNRCDLAWTSYSNTLSHPTPVTVVSPAVSGTQQQVNATGNYVVTYSVVITTAGGFTGNMTLYLFKNVGTLVNTSSTQCTGNGIYTLPTTLNVYLADGDYLTAFVELGASAPADFIVDSRFTLQRTS